MALLQASARCLRPGAASYLPQLQHLRHFAVVSGEDSHDDFKPVYKEEPVTDAEQQIQKDITNHDVFIYMKGTPNAPECGFSNMACSILNAYKFEYGSRNVLADLNVREGIKKFTGWPTIPQIFYKGEFVGGCDILMEMHKAGELAKMAEDLGVADKQ
jgi:monothiol glutaredoxin